MKKTIKHPDGTEEILEGTAEEIAELERQLDATRKVVDESKDPRGVLHGRSPVTGEPYRAGAEYIDLRNGMRYQWDGASWKWCGIRVPSPYSLSYPV